MALLKELKGSFVGGKISRSLQNRIDLEKFNTWLKEAKNTFIKPEGSISNRAGTVYVGATKIISYKLTINVNVSATIIINGIKYTGTSTAVDLPADNPVYEYSVGAVGYEVKTGSGTIAGNTAISVTLEENSTQYTYTITNTQGATITINGVEQSSITADSGTYIEWSVEKEGYESQSGSFLLSEDKTDEIELVATTKFVLSINASPSNATIKVKVSDETIFEGASPASLTLDAGTVYSYEISLSGYITEEGGGTLNQDTSVSTTLQRSSVELTNLAPTISGSKPTTYGVNYLYSYSIKKTGTYKIQLGGSKGHILQGSEATNPATKGGTAVLQTTFTSGDIITIYRIDGGYWQTMCYGGSGIGVKVNDVWTLVVGGGGRGYETNNGYRMSGGGGYAGGGGTSSLNISGGISYNGSVGSGTGNTNGSGQTNNVGNLLSPAYAYGGTGYVIPALSSYATMTTGNNNEEGYAKIYYLG